MRVIFLRRAIGTATPWLIVLCAPAVLGAQTTWIENFGRTLFTGEGIHPAVGSIVPGGGLAAGGALNLARALQSKPLRFIGSVEARRSVSGFWEAGGQLLVTGSGRRDDDRHVIASVFGRRRVQPMLPHFGIGDATTLADAASYGLSLTTIGGQLTVPLAHGFSVSASLEALSAALQATPELPSAQDHMTVGGGIGWRFASGSGSRGYRTDARADWRLFHATGDAPLSFRRLDAVWAQRWRPGTKRDPGELTFLVRFTGSMASDGEMVPFYLQPTLGGQDVNGTPTLRSYRDYRFRARHAAAFTLEYEHGIANWPVGLWGFVDAGQVAARRTDFDLGRLRTSVGLGATLKAGGLPVVKLYVAWGGGEGSHTTFTGNSNDFGPQGTPRGVF